MKINRLEMLKANIGLELIAGHEELDKFMSGILRGRTEEELKRQAGILGKTVLNNTQKAHAIVNASFHNATFSDRVWMYQDLLKADLSKLLQSGLIQGKNPRALARDLKKAFNTSTFNAERLMRTELARVQTGAQQQAFKRNGFDEYEFIVNGGCCPICEALKGKHFKVDKMMPGENAPPMHPHCRCSTAAYSDRQDYEEWLDFLDKGGTTEEYNKLKAAKVNSLVTNKDAESNKIKAEIFKPAETIEEAEVYARDTLGLDCSYKGVDLKVANEMNAAFARGLKYCPAIRDKLNMVGSAQERNKLFKADMTAYYDDYFRKNYPGRSESWYKQYAKKYAAKTVGTVSGNTYAFASSTIQGNAADIVNKYSGVFVNNKFGKNAADFTSLLQNDVKIGWHPLGCDAIASVFDHEMAHQIDYAVGLRKNNEIVTLWKSLTQTEIQTGLSGYGAKNVAKFIAEGYAEYCNSENPREIATKIGAIIKKAVKQ